MLSECDITTEHIKYYKSFCYITHSKYSSEVTIKLHLPCCPLFPPLGGSLLNTLVGLLVSWVPTWSVDSVCDVTVCGMVPRRQPPPAYSVAAQLAARQHRLGRAHSHEGVTSHHPHLHYPPDEDGMYLPCCNADGGKVIDLHCTSNN